MPDDDTTPSAASEKKPATEPVTVLCADDEELVLFFYQATLRKRGYKVLCCQQGDRVIPMLAEHPDVAVLLLDLNMPHTNGLQILQALRQSDDLTRLPVIIVSADDREESVTDGLSLGADDYLVKPITGGELVGKIGMILRKRRLAKLTARGLSAGSLVGGRYEILTRLGSGGFATVYLARDLLTRDGAQVAIKTFHGDRTDSKDFVARFLREANAHCRLEHPNIVRMYDFGQRDNLYYLVMEYLEGMNLEQISATKDRLEEQTAAFIAADILQALDYLQQHGLVHRDVKLRNILITRDGVSKLLDFGLTRKSNEETLSNGSELSGTPMYLSPEYIRASEGIDIRSDVYALGITLYRLLTGKLPYPPSSDLEIVHHHLNTAPIPVAELRPDLSPRFANLLDSMLIKECENRPFPSALLTSLYGLLDQSQ